MPVSAEMVAIAAQIETLTPPDRLRLAAALIEAKRDDIAHSIVDRVATELGAAIALRKIRGGG